MLLNLRLPNTDGVEVCRQVKNDKELKHITAILFTATADISVVKMVKEHRADDYLVKLYEPEELLEKVKALHPNNGFNLNLTHQLPVLISRKGCI